MLVCIYQDRKMPACIYIYIYIYIYILACIYILQRELDELLHEMRFGSDCTHKKTNIISTHGYMYFSRFLLV